MRAYNQAVRANETLARSHRENAEASAGLWDALAGHGEPIADSYDAAVADTAPVEHVSLLATSEVAAVYAFGCHWRARPSWRTTPREKRDIARVAWDEFAERAKSTEALAAGFGWSLEEAWATVQDVNTSQHTLDTIQRIARLAGRMYAAMRGASARRVVGMPEEMHDVEQGSHLGRLLPSELVQLFDSELDTPAFQRLIENRSLQYAMRGTSTASKGPLVVALDESGSMHAQRREWSKAAAIALMRVAFDEKRPVAIVHFSTSTVVRHITPGDSKGVLAMIRHFLDGGTAIGTALRVAVDAVKDLAKKGKGGADIVLVTDGVDGDLAPQKAALDEAKALGARLWTVAIECTIYAGNPLRDYATHYAELGAAQMTDARSIVAFGGAATGQPTKGAS
jgi:uncharacterized protein with von Willebrand factor type A (vWA) domain